MRARTVPETASDLGIPAPMKRRQRLEARNRQEPSRNLRTTFEPIGLAPDVDEDLANEVLGSASVGDQSGDEVIKPYIVPGVQGPHGGLVASCDRLH
jgi:hypothetical protein